MRYLLIVGLASIAYAQFDKEQPCFCKIGEAVEACSCAESSIDNLNNHHIYDHLQKLLNRDFFRFYKVNMHKECPFWKEDHQCASRQCGIAFCDDEVPAGLRETEAAAKLTVRTRNNTRSSSQPSKAKIQETEGGCQQKEEQSNAFDPMDRTLEDSQREQLDEMDIHDWESGNFCELDDEDSQDAHYVDLSKNPERYTGYKGDSAARVWKSIYSENCFKPDPKFDKNFLVNPNNFGLCLEKRVFYRLISGLHSAITISIAAHNYKEPPPGVFGAKGTWFRNTQMFAGRFGTQWSWEGPQRLRNVYFVYLLELRALQKVAPYLKKEMFYTGNDVEDAETRKLVEEILATVTGFPDQFNEHEMFTGVDAQARALREEFRSHFVNISRIMDCVACDKCRLWGKVQVNGMGTALKILFSDLPYSHTQYKAKELEKLPFQLTRNEVVALFQSFGRYSSSIREVHEFRKEMLPAASFEKEL